MPRTDSLWVVWKEPAHGRRTRIGHLGRAAGLYSFRYDDVGSAAAAMEGFEPLTEFPDLAGNYQSRYLFPTFSQRIPDPTRPDRARIMESFGVQDLDDPFEVLIRTGGVQATDGLEILEARPLDDALTQPLSFRLAGQQRLQGQPLPAGTPVTLEREPTNPIDRFAVRVVSPAGAVIGYVPRPYSELVSRRLEGRPLRATYVRTVRLPVADGAGVVEVVAH